MAFQNAEARRPGRDRSELPDWEGSFCSVLEDAHCGKCMLPHIVYPLQESSNLQQQYIQLQFYQQCTKKFEPKPFFCLRLSTSALTKLDAP